MSNISIEELGLIVRVLTCMVTALGVVLAIVQWRNSLLIKRGELIDLIFEKFRSDENIRKAVYLFDYDQQWYTESFHNASGKTGKEDCVDVGLQYFSYVCYLWKIGILKRKDFDLFRYTICRAVSNYGTKDYFYNLYHFSRAQHTDFPFPALLWFARKEKILEDDFYSPTAYKKPDTWFHRNLNF